MKVLIVHGSKRGGTEGIARTIGEELISAGHQVTVEAAQRVSDVAGWDAVIVGGGLYAGRWHRQARRFVRSHVDELRRLPVWFFSSGPLDDSARGDLPPARQVRDLLARVGARGHITFGGFLAPDARGLIASSLAKHGHAGDWRDPERVRAWTRSIEPVLAEVPARPAAARAPARGRADRIIHLALGLLLGFGALNAFGGGIYGMLGARDVPTAWLEGTPFSDYRIPSLILFAVVGGAFLFAAVLVLARAPIARVAALAAVAIVAGWLVTQVALIGYVSWMQPVTAAAAVVMLLLASRLRYPGAVGRA